MWSMSICDGLTDVETRVTPVSAVDLETEARAIYLCELQGGAYVCPWEGRRTYLRAKWGWGVKQM